ncbi:putative Mce family protein [Patulibacter medicamentivorans]|uniref:Putative Mce family protein n=1 Tax=Patulibacter medicamentivorans TaxID=1097667 RepID=H0EAY3_9ACTN|nr:MlaD family protein [Patulibacter medicamentivorans]EHN09151.1 putative Mce family protein [Patulibacter medicamentivorans]
MKGLSRIAPTVAATALTATMVGCGGGGSEGATGQTRVDALFDNASFVNNGQEVRIAGARVGTVEGVELTDDRRARVKMSVDSAFAPFRADASCSILPQSLIGEKFVECDGGTNGAPVLAAKDDEVPTVPLKNNNSPVDLDLVVAMLGEPTNVRLQLLFNELGITTASRGADISAAIRRANPALRAIRDTLDVVSDDRAALGRVIDAADTVGAELDRRKDDLAGVFDSGAEVLKATSEERVALDRALATLPSSLAALRPALTELRSLSRDGTPTVRALRVAAPSLRTLAGNVEPLSDSARPTLRTLASAARTGIPVVKRTAPQMARLRRTTAALVPNVPLAADLGTSLVDNAFPENFLSGFFYNAALATSRFDDISHILPAHLNLGPCMFPAIAVQSGCSARFADDGTGKDITSQQPNAETRAKVNSELSRMLGRPAAPKARVAERKAGR